MGPGRGLRSGKGGEGGPRKKVEKKCKDREDMLNEEERGKILITK